tara:strand:+ start:1273 stop:1452 length:180 start_codon:yes stop_codon:yes gene_type:complete
MKGPKSEKDFKPHMMYSPDGKKAVMTKTFKEHLALKNKGFSHEKMAKKKNGKMMGGSGY